MKKFVKPLVIATSVAAIAGIGAVSFAAWSGSSTDVDVNGGVTGTLTLANISSTTTLSDALLPYDQPGTPATGYTEMWTIVLTVAGDDIAAYDIEGYATTTIEEGTLYYQISTTTVTQPTAAADLTGWTALSTDDENPTTLNTSALAAGTYNVYIILDSSDMSKDGNKTIDLHFELAEA